MATDERGQDSAQGRDEKTVALRESIQRSFCAEPYAGRITRFDGKYDPDNEETAVLDDDQALYEALNGRRWTEVPIQLLHNYPDGYVLLTDEAFLAFLPAWLMHSLERIDEENEVRNFVVYSFSSTMRQFRVLNPEQQHTVRSILVEFTERGTGQSVRKLATEAVALIDRCRY
jgi:hypothetical protein